MIRTTIHALAELAALGLFAWLIFVLSIVWVTGGSWP